MTIYRFPNLQSCTLLSACLALGLAGVSPALASETSSQSATSTSAQEPREDAADSGTGMEGEVDQEMLDQGRSVFLEEAKPSCQICHVLEDAEAKGRVGPNLDEMKLDAEMVRNALMSGPGAMPDYAERLDEAQIEAVSVYVAEVSGAASEDEATQND
jgi:mono/diheme cytochrome c family protein